MSDYERHINPRKTAETIEHYKMPVGEQRAAKFDRRENKPALSMIPKSSLDLEAAVLAFGAKKYERNNWKKGMEWTRLVDSALRHITAWNDGEELDPESGLSHLAHAKCCLSFLIEYQTKGLGEDDR